MPYGRHASLALTALLLAAAPRPAHAQGGGGGAGAGRRGGEPESNEITLAVGEQHSLPAANIQRYSEGVGGIVDVRVPADGSRLLLVAQRTGTTSLLVIYNNGTQTTYTINVVRVPVEVVRRQLTQLLQGHTGVQINQIGGMIFLEGGVSTEQQQRRVQQIAAIYPGQVESLVVVDPTVVAQRINVRIDLYFVELSASSSYIFGVNWPGSLFGGTAAVNATLGLAPPGMTGLLQGTVTAIINQPLPRLDLASNLGWVRVHRQATLVTANGNEAAYHSGGELNFQIGNGIVTDIRRIEFGSTLSITPRYDPTTSRVELRVQADLSDLTETGTAIPGRTVSRVNTQVNLQLGQSMILSGMRSRSSASGTQGIPFLSQIPLIGPLFGSQLRRQRDTEMVVFVVPTVIEGMSRRAEDRVARALRAYEDFGSLVTGIGGAVGDHQLVPRPVDPPAPPAEPAPPPEPSPPEPEPTSPPPTRQGGRGRGR